MLCFIVEVWKKYDEYGLKVLHKLPMDVQKLNDHK